MSMTSAEEVSIQAVSPESALGVRGALAVEMAGVLKMAGSVAGAVSAWATEVSRSNRRAAMSAGSDCLQSDQIRAIDAFLARGG
jgi:hypothetical protein